MGRYVKLVSDILTLSGAGGFEWDGLIKLAGGAFGTAVLLGVALIDDEADDGRGICGTIGCCGSSVENSDGIASALGNCKPLSCVGSGYGFVGTNAGLLSSRKCSLQVGVGGLLSWSRAGRRTSAVGGVCPTPAEFGSAFDDGKLYEESVGITAGIGMSTDSSLTGLG